MSIPLSDPFQWEGSWHAGGGTVHADVINVRWTRPKVPECVRKLASDRMPSFP
jgi:hypothetical protein